MTFKQAQKCRSIVQKTSVDMPTPLHHIAGYEALVGKQANKVKESIITEKGTASYEK